MKEQTSANGAEKFASSAIAALDFLAVCQIRILSHNQREQTALYLCRHNIKVWNLLGLALKCTRNQWCCRWCFHHHVSCSCHPAQYMNRRQKKSRKIIVWGLLTFWGRGRGVPAGFPEFLLKQITTEDWRMLRHERRELARRNFTTCPNVTHCNSLKEFTY